MYDVFRITAIDHMYMYNNYTCYIFIMALAFPVSRHDKSLHVFSLVSGITPDLQVDRRESIVEIYPPTYISPHVLIITV